jgi:hypothetical protein
LKAANTTRISSELYDCSAHCILELLQNADDCRYDDKVVPTLSFTFEPGALRVDCNELGFHPEHVVAISTVRSSTKSNGKHTHQYTGEKGIGFKSVYSIADEVWVSSCQYRFKFDKRQRFGMIAPLWAEFPRPVIPEVTSFFLRLAEGYEERELARELQNFDPRLLLFLHRIQKVVLRVSDEAGTEWFRTLRRTNTQKGNIETTTLHIDDDQLHFSTFEHRVEDLP